MPLVWRRIRDELGREPSKAVHPDEAVAIGAALLADSKSRIDAALLIDVLPLGIGVGQVGGRVVQVLPRNTKLPAQRTYEVATERDGQTELELVVFQGDSSWALECEYLGTVRVDDLPAAPRGQVRVAVEFALGAEGILSVSARDLATGRVTRAQLATVDKPADVRRKLQIPEAPPAPARPPASEPVPPARLESSRKGLLGRIFGRK